jgi:hypothetical protein
LLVGGEFSGDPDDGLEWGKPGEELSLPKSKLRSRITEGLDVEGPAGRFIGDDCFGRLDFLVAVSRMAGPMDDVGTVEMAHMEPAVVAGVAAYAVSGVTG